MGGWSAFKLVLEVHFPHGPQAELREKFHVADIDAHYPVASGTCSQFAMTLMISPRL